MTKTIRRAMLSAACAVLSLFTHSAFAQSRRAAAPTPTATPSPQPTQPPPQRQIVADAANTIKAEQILRRAIEVLGGNAYTSVRTLTGRGLFTPFKDGAPGDPSTFVDYIVYPDHERTEFRGGGTRIVQTDVGDKGWIYDGAAGTLKDMTREQVEDFKFGMRTSIDNLLRGVWRKDSATKLNYVGRREAGLAKRNEVVRLTYPDGFTVEFEFDARAGLPAKVSYMRKDTEGKESTEEDRLAQFISIGGILTPFVIDHYRAGAQTSRLNYRSLEFNTPIADELFAKPASLKMLK